MAERQAPWLQIAKILVAIAVAWFASLLLLGQQTADTAPIEPVSFALYPNPAGAWVKVVSDEDVIVSLMNVAGQQVKAFGSTYRKIHELDVSGLSPGLYLVQVRNANHQQTGHKLVIF